MLLPLNLVFCAFLLRICPVSLAPKNDLKRLYYPRCCSDHALGSSLSRLNLLSDPWRCLRPLCFLGKYIYVASNLMCVGVLSVSGFPPANCTHDPAGNRARLAQTWLPSAL
ncbi:hypothetical protein XELAEV_18041121mg [Xenopus laevis]|uniref:Secreted protein n=1 Tax=Xenopus laevis TaxID=8355 RepID=A0A974C1Q9_XENLA|nr:hypothetical protein XELAEV_18041121mg [Xenopus laevis]